MKTRECYDTGLLLFFFCKSLLAWCPESEPISLNSGSPSGCSSARVIRAHLCFPSLYGFQIFPLLLFSSQQLIKWCVCYHYIYNHSYITLTVSAFNPDVLHSLDFNVKICNLTYVTLKNRVNAKVKLLFLTASSRQKLSGFNRSLKYTTTINTLLINVQSQSF